MGDGGLGGHHENSVVDVDPVVESGFHHTGSVVVDFCVVVVIVVVVVVVEGEVVVVDVVGSGRHQTNSVVVDGFCVVVVVVDSGFHQICCVVVVGFCVVGCVHQVTGFVVVVVATSVVVHQGSGGEG